MLGALPKRRGQLKQPDLDATHQIIKGLSIFRVLGDPRNSSERNLVLSRDQSMPRLGIVPSSSINEPMMLAMDSLANAHPYAARARKR
jgi:hypothetical protein